MNLLVNFVNLILIFYSHIFDKLTAYKFNTEF